MKKKLNKKDAQFLKQIRTLDRNDGYVFATYTKGKKGFGSIAFDNLPNMIDFIVKDALAGRLKGLQFTAFTWEQAKHLQIKPFGK